VSQLLEGLRVLDLTNVLAGPFCGYQLALQGAEVIKVEVPDSGDLARQLGADQELNKGLMGASFLAQNGGKKSITLNLKNKAGREVFLKLVKTADIVIENYRPGVMERLAVDYEVLRKVKPDLIYCAISGFGQDGPMSENPAYDQIIQGLAGVMSITGGENSSPFRVGFPVCDTIGGITAAFSICAALYRRQACGEGQFIDVSMLDSTLVSLGWAVSNWLIAGVEPKPMGNENVTASPSGTFKTGNGLLNIAANKQEQFETLCRLLNLPQLIDDPRFSEREARKSNRFLLNIEIENGLVLRSAEEWEVILNNANVPAGRVLTIPEALEHPQIRHRELVQSFEPVQGIDRPVKILRSGFKIKDTLVGVKSPPPNLGQDTDKLLTDLGYTAGEIAKLRTERVI
jgi:CoA:oxalate CoA-transferase